MLEHKWQASLKLHYWFYLLTLKLLKKSRVFNTVKAFNAIVTTPRNCLNWKKKVSNKKQVMLFKLFLCDILSNSCNAQYFHTTGHTYARLTFVVSLVVNEFSSQYCCVGLITMTNSILTYHRH